MDSNIGVTSIESGVVEWQLPSFAPQLSDGEMHLWRIDLASISHEEKLERLLSPDEELRASRLISPKKRAAFTAGRAALRLILSEYMGLLPETIEFGYSEMGKPFVLRPPQGSDLHFNLSHSNKWMILGITNSAEIGVDIEEVRSVIHAWALKQLFSDKDRHQFGLLSEEEKAREFIAAWTIKEAAGKADGAGISASSSESLFSNSEKEIQQIDGYSYWQQDATWFLHFEPVPGYLASAAIRSNYMPAVKIYDFLIDEKTQPLIADLG